MSPLLLLVVAIAAVHGADVSGGQGAWLPAHNDVRCGWGQATVQWSPTLAAAAAQWAATCPQPAAPHDPSTQDGENVFFLSAGVAPFSGNVVTQLWASEASSWTCATNACNDSATRCLHFTQIVWSSTTQIGCASTDSCAGAFPVVYVCRYRVAGNVVGVHPLGGTAQCALNGGGSCGTATSSTATSSTSATNTNTNTSTSSGTSTSTSTPFPTVTPQPTYPPVCAAEQTVIKKIRPPSTKVHFLFEGMFDGYCKNAATPPPCPLPCTGVQEPNTVRSLAHLVL